MNSITLVAGDLKLAVNPSIGGSISSFEWLGRGGPRPILRECHTALEKVLDAACFPLVPFVNRIRMGAFSFRGREVHLAPNMRGDPSPLHGQGWLAKWQVVESEAAAAVLAYLHHPDEWPWPYEARQIFKLDPGGLSLTLTCTNSSDDPMPCGLGQHPYFPCGAATRLRTSVETAWTIDENVLPVEQVPARGRYNLRNRLVCGQGLDNGFGGWGGQACMSDPDWPYEIRMRSPEARFFQIYSPAEGGIFVAEPVTHANAALNTPEVEWHALGLRVLGPGEQMSLTMCIDVSPVEP
jgi:aldose 1-epimerase